MRVASPLEEVEQAMFAQYLDARGLLWFHVPNGRMRNARVGAKLKREGVKRGVLDNWIMEEPPGLFGIKAVIIEMKRRDATPSDTSPEQREWMTQLIRRSYAAHEARGFDDARAITERYYPSGWRPSP